MNKFDKHKVNIARIFPENFGTSIAFIDQKGDGYLYNVVSRFPSPPFPPSPIGSHFQFFEHHIIQIPDLPSGTKSILWETNPENEVKPPKQFDRTVIFVFSGSLPLSMRMR